jgi:dihydrolipoamide dehydrogenase
MSQYDVTIIGSGPGGYVAAIRCAQLGLKTAIIERYATKGGTCLNVGCIPSKALLDSSHHFEEAQKNFTNHGIDFDGEPKVNMKNMMKRKSEVVNQTTKGIDFLMDKNKIDSYHGHGSFVDEHTISVKSNDGKTQEITTQNTIIATGSKPNELPFAPLDKERIISSTEALSLKEVPKHLILVGGGVIGLELGQVYKRLGADVTVIEYLDHIIPSMDKSMGKEMMRVMKKQKVKFKVSHQVTDIKRDGDEVTVKAKDKKGKEVSFTGDYCLVSIGRKPYTAELNAEKAGVELNEKGQVKVGENLKTTADSIYAIGDVVEGAMLAHKAEEEGSFVAEVIAGQKPHIDYNLIPNVVYTWPEIASVGKSEEQLKEEGIEYKSGQFPMRALGRSRASGDIDGMIKILSHKETDEVLGVHMIAARAADLIAEAVTAMEFRASAEDIARMSHAHPTYAEAIKEAALASTENRPLHI